MQREYFKILKEINSLMQNRQEFGKKIEAEENRLTYIIDQREKREIELNNFKLVLKESSLKEQAIENELVHAQEKLNKANSNLNNITDANQEKALAVQINTLNSTIDNLEEEGLVILEEIELLNEKIQKAQKFLEGSKETLEEIKIEVNSETEALSDKISKLNQRIESLKEELPPKFNTTIDSAIKRKLAISIFTRIIGSNCEFCKLGLSKVDVDAVEKRLELLTCNGCKRIFIPETATY